MSNILDTLAKVDLCVHFDGALSLNCWRVWPLIANWQWVATSRACKRMYSRMIWRRSKPHGNGSATCSPQAMI